MTYAKVTQRILAFFVDAMILILLIAVVEAFGLPVYDDLIILDAPVGEAGDAIHRAAPSLFGIAITIALVWGYYVGFEVSNYQATPGKIALAIRVTDLEGRRVGIVRATVRHFAKILTVLTAFIGFFMAVFTRKRQTLHDLIAGCLVVARQK